MKAISFLFCFACIPTMTLSTAYKLTHPLYNPGLFSVFNTVLGALDYYETTPSCEGLAVDFGNQGLFYDDTHGTNWWEYYFEPIQLKKVDGVITEEKFPTYKKITLSLAAEFKMSRERGSELIKKYVRLKPHVQKRLDTFMEKHFKDNVIGVHYRGTDKKSEASTLSYEEVASSLEKEIDSDEHTKIFVATDDENFITYMQTRFPGKIICLDAIRSHDDKPIHYPRSNDMYKKGEDAVIDCLLLSRCSKLYKMASNLSDTSCKFNPLLSVTNLNRSDSEKVEAEYHSPFTTLNMVLALLNHYEKNATEGLTVDLPVRGEKYADQKGSNWWEYHFLPLSVGEKPEKLKLPLYMNTILGLENSFEMSPERAHELITRYVQIRPETLAKIDAFVDEKFKGQAILGIYYKKQGGAEWLQPSVAHDTVLDVVEKEKKKAPGQILFLVTNDRQFFTKINERFSQVLFYHEPADSEEPATFYQESTGNKQTAAEYEELNLVQCVLLSKTNTVIGTASDLLKAVSQFNPAVPVKELDTLWLEKK